MMYTRLISEKKLCDWNKEAPYYVYISLNNTCNANCIFCDVHTNKYKYNCLDIYKLIDELSVMGVQYVHFMGGGEPFTDSHIIDYMEYITAKGMSVACTTNAFALNSQKIKRLKNCNLKHIFISIDGSRKEIHDKLRRVEGIFDKAVNVINCLKQEIKGIDIVVNHVINRLNIDSFEDMIKLGKNVHFDYLNLLLVKDNPELDVTEEQKDWFLRNIATFKNLSEQVGVKFFTEDINIFEKRCQDINFACYFPSYSAYIDCPTGGVYPCDCTIHRGNRFCYGNLLEQSFVEIWTGEKLSMLREQLLKKPISCKKNCDITNVISNNCIDGRKDE